MCAPHCRFLFTPTLVGGAWGFFFVPRDKWLTLPITNARVSQRESEETKMSNGGGRSAGVGVWGFGSILAITLSWSVNHSIVWMILHGICSWFYVIYYAVEKK